MGKVVLELSISLDGFIAGPKISTAASLGRGGERLYEWMFAEKSAEQSRSFETAHFGRRRGADHGTPYGRPWHRRLG